MKDGQSFSTRLNHFLEAETFSSCAEAEEILNTLKSCGTANDCEAPQEAVNKILDLLNALKENIIRPMKERVEQCFSWEHDRWSAFLIESEGFQSVTSQEAVRCIQAGNIGGHQCHLAKLHPCLTKSCHLKTSAEELQQALGELKDFETPDEQSLFATAELLLEEVLHLDSEITAKLQKLFCLSNDDF